MDLSDIIRNSYDVLHTKRVHCYISDETELKISVNSPKNSILFKIYDEKSKFTEGYNSSKTW